QQLEYIIHPLAWRDEHLQVIDGADRLEPGQRRRARHQPDPPEDAAELRETRQAAACHQERVERGSDVEEPEPDLRGRMPRHLGRVQMHALVEALDLMARCAI